MFVGGLVTRGEIREIPGGVDLRLVLHEKARGYQVSTGANRLKVAVTDDEGLVEGGLFLPLEPVRIGRDASQVRTIVIYPGHGGSDLGASLPGGMAEKDVALEIASREAQRLQQGSPRKVSSDQQSRQKRCGASVTAPQPGQRGGSAKSRAGFSALPAQAAAACMSEV